MSVAMDKESVAELQEKLKRYCLFLTDNQWEADDLAQEAWLKALKAGSANDHANPHALLLRIAKNCWIDHTRRQKLQMKYMEQEQRTVISTIEPNIGHLELIFQALMKHMTPLQQAVFLLKDVYDYSIAEAAQTLKTTQGAVKAALHRARQSLDRVQRELEKDVRLDQDTGLLMSLAAAYQLGDVATVVALAMNGVVEPTAAVVIAHNQRIAVNAQNNKRMFSTRRMSSTQSMTKSHMSLGSMDNSFYVEATLVA